MSTLQRAIYLIRYGKYVPNEYLIRKDKKIVYIPIPKIACTSIKEAIFGDIRLVNDFGVHGMTIHSTLSETTVRVLSASQRNYYKIAFVRNPFDRLISCYIDKVCKESQHIGRYYFDTHFSKIVLRGFSGYQFQPSMSFEEFVTAVSRIPDTFADGHFRSQFSFLTHQSNLLPDFVGRFESLAKEWKEISEHCGLGELPHRNKTQATDLVSWYKNKELIERTYRRYARDFDIWYPEAVDNLIRAI